MKASPFFFYYERAKAFLEKNNMGRIYVTMQKYLRHAS